MIELGKTVYADCTPLASSERAASSRGLRGTLMALKRCLALRSRARTVVCKLLKTRFGLEVARNWYRDWKYGEYLGGVIHSRHKEQGAHHVQSADYCELERVFASIAIGPEEVLVDVGCGKGRVLNFWLGKGYTNRLIGVEIDEQVARQTAQRLQPYPNVTIVCGNILDALPANGTLFFAYNPFDEETVRQFRDVLGQRFTGTRGVRVVYYNCVYCDVFVRDPAWSVRPITSTREPAVVIAMTRVPSKDGNGSAMVVAGRASTEGPPA
jgi:hypothetical protein